MKATFDRGDVRPRSQTERELERVLVRLGAAVDKKHAGEIQLREAHEPLGGARPDLHRHGVRLEVAGLSLLGERLRPAGMPVAESGHGVPAVQIEHPLPLAVQQPHSLGRDDLERELREHGREEVMGEGPRPHA